MSATAADKSTSSIIIIPTESTIPPTMPTPKKIKKEATPTISKTSPPPTTVKFKTTQTASTGGKHNDEFHIKFSTMGRKYLVTINNFIKSIDFIIKEQGNTTSLKGIRNKLSSLYMMLTGVYPLSTQPNRMALLESLDAQIQKWVFVWNAVVKDSQTIDYDQIEEILDKIEKMTISENNMPFTGTKRLRDSSKDRRRNSEDTTGSNDRAGKKQLLAW